MAREPGKYTTEERVKVQRLFLEYIMNGFSATRAVQRIQGLASKEPGSVPYVEYATFMAWKAFDKNFAEAYELAYSMGTDKLEDKAVEMAFDGNASILQFILRMRNPNRYNPKQEVVGDPSRPIEHVHTIKLIAAEMPSPLEVEGPRGRDFVQDSDVVDVEYETVQQ